MPDISVSSQSRDRTGLDFVVDLYLSPILRAGSSRSEAINLLVVSHSGLEFSSN